MGEENIMKKLFLGILCLFLVGCNVGNTRKESYDRYFNIVGIYKRYDTVTDESGVERTWIHVVFDINNSTDENWEDGFFWNTDQHVLTIGDNTYENNQANTDYFAEKYGFTSLYIDEIWSGGKCRFYLNFIVNKKDADNISDGNIMIRYGDMEYNKKFTNKDVMIFTEEAILQLADK